MNSAFEENLNGSRRNVGKFKTALRISDSSLSLFLFLYLSLSIYFCTIILTLLYGLDDFRWNYKFVERDATIKETQRYA